MSQPAHAIQLLPFVSECLRIELRRIVVASRRGASIGYFPRFQVPRGFSCHPGVSEPRPKSGLSNLTRICSLASDLVTTREKFGEDGAAGFACGTVECDVHRGFSVGLESEVWMPSPTTPSPWSTSSRSPSSNAPASPPPTNPGRQHQGPPGLAVSAHVSPRGTQNSGDLPDKTGPQATLLCNGACRAPKSPGVSLMVRSFCAR
jgi:hypothetical protein